MRNTVLDFILGPEKSSPLTVELRGFVCAEDDRCLVVEDGEGTWLVRKSDVLADDPWEPMPGVVSARSNQRPAVLRIRDDAEIVETRRYRISTLEQPMTVSVAQQSSPPVRHLGVATVGERRLPCGPTTTACTVRDEYGLHVKFDDAECH